MAREELLAALWREGERVREHENSTVHACIVGKTSFVATCVPANSKVIVRMLEHEFYICMA